MAKKALPLKNISIEELFMGGETSIYEIPIYQRNYAWEKDEISALVQDVYDSYLKDENRPYYIGTLVTFHKGDQVYEVIDGQQRLTTLRLLLHVLGIKPNNQLTYRARKKSDETLKHIPNFENEEKDIGIVYGYKYAKSAYEDIVPSDKDKQDGFKKYFQTKVHIIHYQVPKDIDLNHYFEIMNSRGEQLEKHEIVKAKLMEKLKDDDERSVFNSIWESCSEMSIYVQQNIEDIKPEDVFGQSLCDFLPDSFEDILKKYNERKKQGGGVITSVSLQGILDTSAKRGWMQLEDESERKDSFQPIIDFPNFLLIVLKICRMKEDVFFPSDFKLDDKELITEFIDNIHMDRDQVKTFSYNLLKARYFLDNYVVHHSKEEDTAESNPWKLQVWQRDEKNKAYLKNLTEDAKLQDKLAQLLSMFEVSFTPRQRKNYLFYCLLYLMESKGIELSAYSDFVEKLADRYFVQVYLDCEKLNSINTPKPGSFDEVVLDGRRLSDSVIERKEKSAFCFVYGDGTQKSDGVPLFVFNYLDYKLWKKYDAELRGKQLKEESAERRRFFNDLGCGDFGLDIFDQFYFSRTRRSLEHYYPQANAKGDGKSLDENQINCMGNYAMIGSEANSSGSNWSPEAKLKHYLDSSKKISSISVASLKFWIMMQICKEKSRWEFEEIKEHQEKMLSILMD